MLNESVRIEFVSEGENGTLDYNGTANSLLGQGNSITPQTDGKLATALNTPHIGDNPFIIGASKLDGSTKWARRGEFYNGFMHRAITDSEGNYPLDNPFTFNIYGNGIKLFIIYFDSVAQIYPISLTVNNQTYTNDNDFFIWSSDEPQSSITVKINSMNKPLYSYRMTSIIIGLTKTYDKFSGLELADRGSQSISDNIMPNYVATGQRGSFEIIDIDGVILELEELHLITPDIEVDLLNADIIIGRYIFEEHDYNVNERRLNVTLKDSLDKWYDITTPSQDLERTVTAINIYTVLKDYGKSAVPSYDIDDTALEALNIAEINYCIETENPTLRDAWQKLNELTGTVSSLDDDGVMVTRML
jgi:hypothetical protein